MSMPCDGVRYLAGLYSLDEIGPLMRRQGCQVGMNEVDRWIALTDAGSGLEHFMEVQFPRAVCVLDFQHPVGYLTPLTNALRDSPEEREALLWWQATGAGSRRIATKRTRRPWDSLRASTTRSEPSRGKPLVSGMSFTTQTPPQPTSLWAD